MFPLYADCLGTTFNATSLMQCPKCMQIEPGQWQYATSLQNPNSIAEEDETIPEYSIEMVIFVSVLNRCYSVWCF